MMRDPANKRAPSALETRPIDQPRMSNRLRARGAAPDQRLIIAFALYDSDKWPTLTAPAARDSLRR